MRSALLTYAFCNTFCLDLSILVWVLFVFRSPASPRFPLDCLYAGCARICVFHCAQDDEGMTPLHVVGQSGDKEMATFLFENGEE